MNYSQYDEIAENYDSLFQDEASLKENGEVRDMLSPLHGSVYEIGCGTGLLVELLNIERSLYRGADPSKGMLDVFLRKMPEYKDSLFAGKVEEDIVSFSNFDNIVSLFGSPSYVDYEYVRKIAETRQGRFLMFYGEDYHPVTYEKTHVEFVHNRYSKAQLSRVFPNDRIFTYHNYIIVTNLS